MSEAVQTAQKMKYQYPKPRECLNCGSVCYARDWFDRTTTGRLYGRDIVKVKWKCSGCGRHFETMEHLSQILMESVELPETRYSASVIELEAEIEPEQLSEGI